MKELNRVLRVLNMVLLLCAFAPCESWSQSSPPMPPPPPSGRVLNVWRFNTNFNGLLGHVQPLACTNVSLTPDWDGNGLLVDSTNAAFLAYPVVTTIGWTNLDCLQGSVETWYMPSFSNAIANWGTLLEVGTWSTNATGAWGLYLDNSNICFAAQSNGFSTNYLSAPINWNAGEWHHIMLTYSATNSSLYLEGQLVTNGPGVSIVPGPDVLTNGFSIGSDGNPGGTGLRQAHGVYNQLISYNYQVDADMIAENYDYDTQYVYPLPSSGGRLTINSNSGPSTPPGDGSDTNSSGSGTTYYAPQYGSNDFWLEALPLGTNAYNADPNALTLILHGTIADIDYQLLSTTNLQSSNTVWTLEQDVLGSEDTNFTTATIPLGTNAQKFFKAMADTLDSTGNGLPDWWQQKYFGFVGVDPYGDPMGDGYNNLYKYEHGMSPNTFYTPAAPNVSAVLNTNGNVIVTWPAAANLPNNGAGAVTGYTLEVRDPYVGTNDFNLPASQLSFQPDLSAYDALTTYIEDPDYFKPPTSALRINYANGSSQWSSFQPPFDPACTVKAAVVRGPQGALYLAVSSVPANVQAIRLLSEWGGLRYPLNYYGYGYGASIFGDQELLDENITSPDTNWISPYFDVPVSSLTNGLYQIPPSQAPLFSAFSFLAMGVGTNGNLGFPVLASPPYDWGNWSVSEDYGAVSLNVPFMDGRTNIAQNINMMLRGAGSQGPFNLALFNFAYYGDNDYQAYEDYAITGQTNYVWDGFSNLGQGDTGMQRYVSIFQRNEFEPFEETSLLTNLIFSPSLFDSTGQFVHQLNVGTLGPQGEVELDDPSKLFDAYNYVSSNPGYPLAPLPPPTLDQTAESWICSPEFILYSVFVQNSDGSYKLPVGSRNIYGLLYQQAKVLMGSNDWQVIASGQSFTPDMWDNPGYFQNVILPVLYTEGYYFARPQIDPVPGQANFAVTNTTPPPFIIPFGQQFYLTAWAKQSVLNGYSGVYAFPQQYFDKAYLADANGNPTTNETGILSEYGDFFPIQPGQVFLTTKPDAATGSVGTNAVYVIKLQLDVNHDSNMDTSFTGPDNTSADRPFVFWVNNDSDIPTKKFPSGEDIDKTNHPDYSLQNIPSQRDLEDWARLWIVGLPDLSTNYQVTLSWNVISGNPAINLVQTVETNGGTLYLTDTNVASQQAGGKSFFLPSYKFANVTPNAPCPISRAYLNGTLTNCFLIEGAGTGKGELVLTISQNGTNIASTSTFIDLRDVKDMFEHAHAENISLNDPPMTNTSVLMVDNYMPSNSAEGQQIVVFVHGINNSWFDYENTSETLFKRLYWQGYHGLFCAFRWPSPTWSLIPTSDDQISYMNFNKGEYLAYQSAAALKAYIDNLRSRFPGCKINLMTHSLGAAVGNEAIRLGAQIDNYAMCQGALSAWAFDGSNTNLIYSYLASGAGGTPDADALGGYNNAFRDSTRRVNFYNEQDWALYSGFDGIWEGNQLHFRPDSFTYPSGFSYSYSFDGTNCFYRLYNNQGSLITSRTLTQDFEKKAYVARSRTKAVGAAGLVNTPHALTGGSVSVNVSLQDANLGFVGGAKFIDTRPEHSGEFTKSIQNTVPFYQQLLQTGFQITPNP